MSNVETLIIANLMRNEEYVRSVLPYIQETYFTDSSYKILFNEISKYFQRYNKVPPGSALKIELNSISLSADVYNKCIEVIKETKEIVDVDFEWLKTQTEKFCQDRAIYNAIMESIKIINDESKLDKGAIPNLLQDALSVCFDANIGHDFLEDYDSRFDFYNEVLERIPFDIEFLNKITRGGIPRKTLNIILAGTGVGKTLMMCHFAAANLMLGKNVLYITLEMAEERISERIDANLLNIPLNELDTTPKEAYISRIERLKKKTQGKLIVKEYPTASAGAGHFRHLLNELRMKKDFVPDIIYIDYLNLCSSSRMKLGASVNSYTYIKAIAEELRGLAIEFDLPIFSATQTNRTGYCLDLETVVETPSGKKLIKDVKVGDKLKTNNGWNNVVTVFPIEEKPRYLIKTKSGKSIVCSGDHWFPVGENEQMKNIHYGLKVGDKLIIKD